MYVADCMTQGVEVVSPKLTLQEAARIMREAETGALPVGRDGRLIGMITDRDIAVRAIADGRGPETRVMDVMTPEVCCCFDDDHLDTAAAIMADNQVRRLPVLRRDDCRLVGIISLGDLSQAADDEDGLRSGEALSAIAEPGGVHVQ